MISPIAPDRQSPRPADPNGPQAPPMPKPDANGWLVVAPRISVKVR